jgi:peptide/nickel transport system substrate-binding protein
MRRAGMKGVLGVAAVLVVAVIAACASSSTSSRASGRLKPALNGSEENLFDGVRGGTLTVHDHADFQTMDPGEAYDTIDNEVILATQRRLFTYMPNQSQTLSPDLASGPAIVSSDGKTVTVHIKRGVYFSPPVDREVTSADVAYAIERGANPNVASPYFGVYFDDIVGASKATGGPIPGIVTPNRYTVVFHLTGSFGTLVRRRTLAGAHGAGAQAVRRAARRQETDALRIGVPGGNRAVHAQR